MPGGAVRIDEAHDATVAAPKPPCAGCQRGDLLAEAKANLLV